jgi:hypothetical protein
MARGLKSSTFMKPTPLTVASLLVIVLLPFHVAGDVVRGFDKGGPGLLILVLILLVIACGTLVLADRRSGHVIMFLGGLGALAMPIIHRNNGFTRAVATSPGGVFFIWTLVVLGVAGGLVMILSVRGVWRMRARKA